MPVLFLSSECCAENANHLLFHSFRVTSAGIYGNAGRNILSGPATVNTDLAAIKNIAFTERVRLQFRSEFFNLFNQVNFSNPNTTVNSAAFGSIRSAGPARQIQFALKLLW